MFRDRSIESTSIIPSARLKFEWLHRQAAFRNTAREGLLVQTSANGGRWLEDRVQGCATDRGYLCELLDRMSKKGVTRALPDELPEWKHIDSGQAIWAIRHYDRKDAASDPSSPFAGGHREASDPDDQAVGLVSTLNAGKRNVANIKYLSANKNALVIARSVWQDGFDNARAEVRTLAPGVVEISLPLKEPTGRESPTGMFLLLLLQALGHAVYL